MVNRLTNMYKGRASQVVVNNIPGAIINNVRGTLAQGDRPSMIYFCHGLDSLLYYLEAKLAGIPLISIPTAGPMCEASHVEARIDRTSPN